MTLSLAMKKHKSSKICLTITLWECFSFQLPSWIEAAGSREIFRILTCLNSIYQMEIIWKMWKHAFFLPFFLVCENLGNVPRKRIGTIAKQWVIKINLRNLEQLIPIWTLYKSQVIKDILFQTVILTCLWKKSKAPTCLPLRADNKVVPCHANSWSGLIQRKWAVGHFISSDFVHLQRS